MRALGRRQALLGGIAIIGAPGGGVLSLGGKPILPSDLTPSGYTSPLGYVLPAAVPLKLMPAAAEATPIHSSWPAFAWGHLPAGSHLVATVGGQAVQVQQDMESRWPDGSVWAARLSFPLPASYVKDQEVVISVAPVAGAPNRTPWITPAAMVAANDVVLRHFDGISTTVATQTSVRDIVANAPRDTWGANPTAGWDVPIAGPVEVMIRAWAYRRAPGAWPTAYHRWIRDTVYMSARSDGSGDVCVHSEMGNWDNPASGGTLGNASASSRWIGYTELFNNGSRIYAWGGPNDARAGTIQGSAFAASGVVGLPSTYSDYTSLAFSAGSGGVLPSGVAPNTPYYVFGKSLFENQAHVNGYQDQKASTIFGANGVLTLPGPLSDNTTYPVLMFEPRDHGNPDGTTTPGVLPSNIVQGTKYRLEPIQGQTNQYRVYLAKGSKADDLAASPLATFGTGASGDTYFRATPIVYTASQAAGTINMVPLLNLQYGTSLDLMGTDALPIVIGKTRALVGVAWDEEYMSRGARLWPRYEQLDKMARPSAATTGIASTAYYPGQRPWGPWLNTTGDNPGDNRIGYVNHNSACALLLPYDQIYQQNARQNAAGWANYMMWWRDPASGRMLVIDNGPDDAGGRYPQMGASRPNTGFNYASREGWRGKFGGGTLEDNSGYYDGYSTAPLDGSHMPCPWPIAAHMTGHPIFGDQGIAQAIAVQLYEGTAAQPTIAGRKLYNVIGLAQQPRGSGWALRAWGYAEVYTPAAYPEAAFIAHAMDTTAAFGSLVTTANFSARAPGFAQGVFWPPFDYGSGGGNVQQYQNNIGGIAIAMEAWRGRRAGMLDLARKKAVFDVGIADASHQGTTYGLVNGYSLAMFNPDNTLRFPNIAAFVAGTPGYVGGAGPYPSTGFYVLNANDPSDNGKSFWAYSIFQSVNYATVMRCALALYASAGVKSTNGDDPAYAYADLNRRMAASPNTGLLGLSGPDYQNGNKQGFFPAFAIVAG